MKYADVIVDISLQKLDKVFQYRVPDELQGVVKPGTLVKVPFGNGGRILSGYVVELDDREKLDPCRIKSIISVDSSAVQIEGQLIALAAWMKRVYGSTMNQALKTTLPVKSAVKGRTKKRISLAVPVEEARAARDSLKASEKARRRLLDALMDEGALIFPEDGRRLKISYKTVTDLAEKGLVISTEEKIYRNPVKNEQCARVPVTLYPEQKSIVDDILKRRACGDLRPSLILGVTGSGKTEIYMELIASVLEEGRQAIVLIPEISLTYQIVRRFRGRFADKVSVLHSGLSAGERFDQLERAKRGDVSVMIGPRSALFTPFGNLGIIVIDEEHEGSYKSENAPRYHARETAMERARLCGACVVMGSATPSVDSYQRAVCGDYKLYTLQKRAKGRSPASVEVIDLCGELKSGNRSIFSRRLDELISDRLEHKEQIMLFLNRRGYAGFVSCRVCGYVVKCPHCDVSLSLHGGGVMRCHYCGYSMPEVRRCPVCGSGFIGAFRAGTQQVTGLLEKNYPGARILRMDRDTTRRKDAYDRIIGSFSRHEADILVGTQMIVKGHDFPNVTLVGILAADMSLHEGDYRSGEKTFQLLTQAAGRAGRGEKPGIALIQTYSPDHYCIKTAAAQDYEEFFRHEISYRRLLGYPPAGHMTAVCVTSADEAALGEFTLRLKEKLDALSDIRSLTVIGPSDASPARINDIYRKVVYVKAYRMEDLIFAKEKLEEYAISSGFIDKINLLFDLDPVNAF